MLVNDLHQRLDNEGFAESEAFILHYLLLFALTIPFKKPTGTVASLLAYKKCLFYAVVNLPASKLGFFYAVPNLLASKLRLFYAAVNLLASKLKFFYRVANFPARSIRFFYTVVNARYPSIRFLPNLLFKRKLNILKQTLTIINSGANIVRIYFTNGLIKTLLAGDLFIDVLPYDTASHDPALMGYTDARRHCFVLNMAAGKASIEVDIV